MTSFKEFISELFNSDKPDISWETESDSQTAANFEAGDRKYTVEFDRKANKIDWEVKFALVSFFDSKHYELTKTGNEFKVFSHVANIIKDFIKNRKPEVLYFTAAKEIPDRARLYDKMIQTFSTQLKQLGYSAREIEGDKTKFIISKIK